MTFKKPIGSISVSGHKFIGAPMPCGVVITRRRYVMALSQDVEYLNSRDATIMGSRNGHAPIYMWYTLTKKGYEGMRKDVERCMRNAHLLKVCPRTTVLICFFKLVLVRRSVRWGWDRCSVCCLLLISGRMDTWVALGPERVCDGLESSFCAHKASILGCCVHDFNAVSAAEVKPRLHLLLNS